MDKKGNGFLSRKEVILLVAGLNIPFDQSSFTAALLRSSVGLRSNEITFSQFESLAHELRRRPDLEVIWNQILTDENFAKTITPLNFKNAFNVCTLQEVVGIATFKEFWLDFSYPSFSSDLQSLGACLKDQG